MGDLPQSGVSLRHWNPLLFDCCNLDAFAACFRPAAASRPFFTPATILSAGFVTIPLRLGFSRPLKTYCKVPN